MCIHILNILLKKKTHSRRLYLNTYKKKGTNNICIHLRVHFYSGRMLLTTFLYVCSYIIILSKYIKLYIYEIHQVKKNA